MAEEFLKRDCAVIINGRSQQSIDNAVEDYTRIVNISLRLVHYDETGSRATFQYGRFRLVVDENEAVSRHTA